MDLAQLFTALFYLLTKLWLTVLYSIIISKELPVRCKINFNYTTCKRRYNTIDKYCHYIPHWIKHVTFLLYCNSNHDFMLMHFKSLELRTEKLCFIDHPPHWPFAVIVYPKQHVFVWLKVWFSQPGCITGVQRAASPRPGHKNNITHQTATQNEGRLLAPHQTLE